MTTEERNRKEYLELRENVEPRVYKDFFGVELDNDIDDA